MNANELADYLLNFIMDVEGYDESKHEKAATMLRKLDGQLAFRIDAVKSYQIKVEQQQAEIEALKQVLDSIANEHVELSHDKIKWQCEDHIRWAKEALK